MVDHGAQNHEIMKFDRLALGTVQFGMDYGIANITGRTPPDEVQRLLSCAKQRGIRTLDTASAYGESEAVLGEVGVEDWEVVSKLPGLPAEIDGLSIDDWFESSICRTLQRLKIGTLHGLLVHQPTDLLGPYGQTLYDLLVDTKNRSTTRKIGVSVYNPDELEALLERYSIDMVQLPLNVFDKRFVDSGWLSDLKRSGVEVHSRSVFLQGLLLMPVEERPAQFRKWGELWSRWDNWLQDSGIHPMTGCLNAVMMHEEIDRVVIGFENVKQFEELCQTPLMSDIGIPSFDDCADETLINPSRWNPK